MTLNECHQGQYIYRSEIMASLMPSKQWLGYGPGSCPCRAAWAWSVSGPPWCRPSHTACCPAHSGTWRWRQRQLLPEPQYTLTMADPDSEHYDWISRVLCAQIMVAHMPKTTHIGPNTLILGLSFKEYVWVLLDIFKNTSKHSSYFSMTSF